MRFPDINQYITKFEDLACLTGYTIGNDPERPVPIGNQGHTVIKDILKPPFATTYNDLKDRTIQTTKAKQLIKGICAKRNYPSTQMSQNMFGTQQPRPCFFNRGNQYTQRRANPTPQFNSSNAPRSMNNQPVPMDISRTRFPCQHFQTNVAEYRQQYDNTRQEEVQVAQTSAPSCHPKGP